MPKHSKRFDSLPVYMLAAIPQKKRDLIARGVDVIDLGAGDADLPAPPKVVAALAAAAHVPAMSRYGFGLGLPAFREAASAWMEKRFGQKFDPLTEMVPLIGSKEGISHLALAYLEPGVPGVPRRHAAQQRRAVPVPHHATHELPGGRGRDSR